MHILLYFLLTLHVLVCLLMVLIVLMQRPRSEGLGAAFGGGMTENIFGAQTTNVLAKFTTWLGGAFFVLTLALAMVYVRLNDQKTGIEKELLAMPTPEAAQASPTPVGALPAESAAPTTPPPAAAPEITEPATAPTEQAAPAAPTPDAATAIPLEPVPPAPVETTPAETAPAAQ